MMRYAARYLSVIVAALLCAASSHAGDGGTGAIANWFDPAKAPFIPIPEIDSDPNGGTTVGVFPTVLSTDGDDNIRRIIAPDVMYNPYFGYGARGRVFAFPSDDSQWSIVGGAKQHVEREFDFEYEDGRARNERWSFATQFAYDRSGIPRFYGIGNQTASKAESNYTFTQTIAGATLGFNITHAWQIAYTLRVRRVDVQSGTFDSIDSIEQRFADTEGIGRGHEWLNRFALSYDTRDDLTVPRTGTYLQLYAGAASTEGLLNASLYSASGADARYFLTLGAKTTLALHTDIRCMSTNRTTPFWALSSLGGDRSVVGEEQPLRGFGAGRFRDRDMISASMEIRRIVWSLNAFTTHIDIELAPFIDKGRVFADTGASLLSHLHTAEGIGFRAIAKPFVVGYIDVGHGDEGVVVFTGINYPF